MLHSGVCGQGKDTSWSRVLDVPRELGQITLGCHNDPQLLHAVNGKFQGLPDHHCDF